MNAKKVLSDTNNKLIIFIGMKLEFQYNETEVS